MKSIYEWIPAILLLVAMAVCTAVAVIQYQSCCDSGGEFVRGVFWFKCV